MEKVQHLPWTKNATSSWKCAPTDCCHLVQLLLNHNVEVSVSVAVEILYMWSRNKVNVYNRHPSSLLQATKALSCRQPSVSNETLPFQQALDGWLKLSPAHKHSNSLLQESSKHKQWNNNETQSLQQEHNGWRALELSQQNPWKKTQYKSWNSGRTSLVG